MELLVDVGFCDAVETVAGEGEAEEGGGALRVGVQGWIGFFHEFYDPEEEFVGEGVE